MIRSPHRTLAQLDTSTAVLAGAVKPLNLGPRRLERSTTTTDGRDLVALLRFATRPGPTGLVVTMPAARRAQVDIEPVRLRVGKATSVRPLSSPQRFPVAPLDLSRQDVTLPYGIGRYVNAATLKAIAGGRSADRLLKRTPAGWEFVPGNTRIDLTDNRQEFRLGKLTIFS